MLNERDVMKIHKLGSASQVLEIIIIIQTSELSGYGDGSFLVRCIVCLE